MLLKSEYHLLTTKTT